MQGPQQSRSDENPAAAPDQLQDKPRGRNNSVAPVELLKEKSPNLTEAVQSTAGTANERTKEKAGSFIQAAKETANEFMDTSAAREAGHESTGTSKANDRGTAPQSGVGLAGILGGSADENADHSKKYTSSEPDGRRSSDMILLRDRVEDAAGAVKHTVNDGAQEMKEKARDISRGPKDRESGDTNHPSADLVNRARGWDSSSELVESIKEKAVTGSEAVKEKSLGAPKKIVQSLKNASEVVQEEAENVGEWAKETARAAVKTVDDTTNALIGSTDETSDAVTGGRNQVQETDKDSHKGENRPMELTAGDASQAVKEKTSGVTDNIVGEFSSDHESAKESPKEMVGDSSGKVNEKAGDSVESVKGTTEAAKVKVGSRYDSSEQTVGDGLKYVQEKSGPMVDSAKEISESAKAKVGSSLESMKEIAEDGVNNVREKAGEMVDSARETVVDGVHTVKDTAGGMVNSSKNVTESAKETAAESVKSAKQTARSTTDSHREKTADSAKAVKEKAGDSAKVVKQKAGDEVEGIKEAAGNVLDSSKDATESLKEKAESKTESAKETAVESVESAKQTAVSTSDSLKEKKTDSAKAVKERAGDGVEGIKEVAGNVTDSSKKAVHADDEQTVSTVDTTKDRAKDDKQPLKEKAGQYAGSAKDAVEATKEGARSRTEQAEGALKAGNRQVSSDSELESDNDHKSTSDVSQDAIAIADDILNTLRGGGSGDMKGAEQSVQNRESSENANQTSLTNVITEKAKDFSQSVKKAGGHAGEVVRDNVGAASNWTGRKAEDTQEAAQDGAGEVKESTSKNVDVSSAVETGKNVTNTVKERAEDASQVVGKRVAATSESVKDKTEEVKDSVHGATDGLQEKQASDFHHHSVMDSIKEKAGSVTQWAKNVTGLASRKVEDAKGTSQERGEPGTAALGAPERHPEESSSNTVDDYPSPTESMKKTAEDPFTAVEERSGYEPESMEERAYSAGEKGEELVHEATESVKEKAGDAAKSARNTTETASQKAEGGMESFREKVKELGHGIPARDAGSVEERAKKLVEDLRPPSDSGKFIVDLSSNGNDTSSFHSRIDIPALHVDSANEIYAIRRTDSVGDPGERVARSFMAGLSEAQDALT